MKHDVVLSMEAVEDVLGITVASQAKTAVVDAIKQVQEALQDNPGEAGEHLSEGLYFIDRAPLRAFYTIDAENASVEIVHVKQV